MLVNAENTDLCFLSAKISVHLRPKLTLGLIMFGIRNMTSPSPLCYNTYYHIYNRGVNGENIFVEERNYDLFLRLSEKDLLPVTDLFAYCMLRNHFHISVRVRSEEEILETKKTLKVSPAKTLKVSQAGSKHNVQNPSASRDEISQRKPLGFDSLGSQYVVINSPISSMPMSRPSIKLTSGQVVYSSIRLNASQLPLTDNFGM